MADSLYHNSDVSQKRSHRSIKERFAGKWVPEPNSGCWLWLGAIDSRGYGTIFSHRVGKVSYPRKAHRVSWCIHNGEIPTGLLVCHKCDTPACVNPDHLFLGTHLDNSDDMIRKNRQASPERKVRRGSQHGAAKLNEKDIINIREKLSEGKTPLEVALMWDIPRRHVYSIRARQIWKHVP